jgi:hypothetical protein
LKEFPKRLGKVVGERVVRIIVKALVFPEAIDLWWHLEGTLAKAT